MTKNGVHGYWRCSVKNRDRLARIYDELSGVEFNALLLRRRRAKALARKREREARRG